MTDESWIAVASTAEIGPGAMLGLHVSGQNVAVFNVDGNYYATSNICTHAYAHLSDGWFEENVIECPLHGGRFDVTTGKGLGAPISCDIRTFPIRIVGTEIQVLVEDSAIVGSVS